MADKKQALIDGSSRNRIMFNVVSMEVSSAILGSERKKLEYTRSKNETGYNFSKDSAGNITAKQISSLFNRSPMS